MVGRKSKNAEQRPSLATAILGMLNSSVFHEKLSIQSVAHLRFGARMTWTPLPLFFLSFPREGRAARAASIATWLAALADSVGVARFSPEREALRVG